MTAVVHEFMLLDDGRRMCRYCGVEDHPSRPRPQLCRNSARIKCASCVHDHHPHSICNGRSGGTAYRCSCTCPDARLAP